MLIITQIAIFLIGVAMLSLSITEPTYEQLLQPIPFIGMVLCIVGILLGMIKGIIDEIRRD